MKVGQDFGEKINQKTFLLHFLKLNFLTGAGVGELSLARRGHSKILTHRKVILEDFLMDRSPLSDPQSTILTLPPPVSLHSLQMVEREPEEGTLSGVGLD